MCKCRDKENHLTSGYCSKDRISDTDRHDELDRNTLPSNDHKEQEVLDSAGNVKSDYYP